MNKIYLLDANPWGFKGGKLSYFKKARSFNDLQSDFLNSFVVEIEENKELYLCEDAFTTKYVYDEVNAFLEFTKLSFNSLDRSKYRRISKGGGSKNKKVFSSIVSNLQEYVDLVGSKICEYPDNFEEFFNAARFNNVQLRSHGVDHPSFADASLIGVALSRAYVGLDSVIVSSDFGLEGFLKGAFKNLLNHNSLGINIVHPLEKHINFSMSINGVSKVRRKIFY